MINQIKRDRVIIKAAAAAVNKKFLKDLAKLPASDRQKIETFVFEESEKIESVES